MIKTIRAIASMKCPHCRSERLFVYPTYNLYRLLKMHPACPKCGQDFMQEPGFYFGAMYISYAINIGIMVFFGLAYEWFIDPSDIWQTMLSVLLPPFLLVPFTFRLSRTINLYVFGRRKR